MATPDIEGLLKLGNRACVLSDAYKLRRESLWWSNLVTLVLPAVLSTVTAIVTALPSAFSPKVFAIPLASVLAGLAAILISLHKVFKCEEYQAECLRLSCEYGSIFIDVESAINSTRDHNAELSRLSNKMTLLVEKSAATVPQRFIDQATKKCS